MENLDTLVQVGVVIAILTTAIEYLCKQVFTAIQNLGANAEVLGKWKPGAVFLLTIGGCFLLDLGLLTQVYPALVLPAHWIDVLLTGILIGGGADIIHLAKNFLEARAAARA